MTIIAGVLYVLGGLLMCGSLLESGKELVRPYEWPALVATSILWPIIVVCGFTSALCRVINTSR